VRSIADVAVLYPQRTVAFYPSGADYLQGLYYALIEGRFIFDFVHEDNLAPEVLQKYRALLIPNGAYLSDQHCRHVRDFVASGGSLLATFETSHYDEWGDRRPDFALADVLGVNATADTIGPLGNSYMRIEQRHAVVAGFDGTALLPGPEARVPVRAAVAAGSIPLTVVPYFPAFPPEMVFPRTPRTDQPAALFQESGRSRIAYFAGDVERTFWRSGNTDLGQLLQNTVRWLRGGAPAVTVDGDGIVELFAWGDRAWLRAPSSQLHEPEHDTRILSPLLPDRTAASGVHRAPRSEDFRGPRAPRRPVAAIHAIG